MKYIHFASDMVLWSKIEKQCICHSSSFQKTIDQKFQEKIYEVNMCLKCAENHFG